MKRISIAVVCAVVVFLGVAILPAQALTCTILTQTMRQGSRDSTSGGEVSKLQVALKELGFLGISPNEYGTFGKKTDRALKSFQRSRGISASGVTDTQTRTAIQTATCTTVPPPPPPPSTTFSLNDRVVTTSSVNVRSTASLNGTLVGTQFLGSKGAIVGGSTYADGYYWWNVNYDSGADGWSIEDSLTDDVALPPPPTPTTQPAPMPTGTGQFMILSSGATNGWGPVEINKSNGETASGDGKTLTINGWTYSTGFGVHATAGLPAAIPSGATSFSASFGIDDETAGTGDASALVSVDGVAKCALLLKAKTDPVKCDIPLSGNSQLLISITPNGVNTSDHVDIGYPWFAISSTTATTTPPLPPPPPATTTPPSGSISVRSFGAVPNDGQNDLAAIQAAVNWSRAGDVIVFDGGTFDLSGFSNADGLTLPGDRTYLGTNGGTLRGKGSNGQLFTLHAGNVSIRNLTFEGGGVFIDNAAGGQNQKVVFDGNVFKIDTVGRNRNGITFTSGLNNSVITNNYFTGYNGSFAIYGYNYNGLTIANNECVNVTACMHIDAFGGSGNLLVEQNYMTGLKGMGMEFQTKATNLTFQDNWYEHPNLVTNRSCDISPNNCGAMAYSLILDQSSNITIRRNGVYAPERPDGTGTRVGFELGGDNSLAEDNYVDYINHVAAMNDGVGTGSSIFRNNRISNYLQAPSCSFCQSISPTRTFIQSNNTPTTALTWDPNRPKPGIGAKRFGGPIIPIQPTILASETTVPAQIAQMLYASVAVVLNSLLKVLGVNL